MKRQPSSSRLTEFDRISIASRATVAAFVASAPGLALAQSSPFLTGATALQTNILAWLTPVAIILVMVLGAMAMAARIVENCGTSVILRCSASERGGTSSFASQLIGQREVVRISESRSRQPLRLLPTITRSEHLSIEPAVLDSEIEQLPDLRGFMKLASSPHWQRIALAPPQATRNLETISQVSSVARRLWEAFKALDSRRDAEPPLRERGQRGAPDDYGR